MRKQINWKTDPPTAQACGIVFKKKFNSFLVGKNMLVSTRNHAMAAYGRENQLVVRAIKNQLEIETIQNDQILKSLDISEKQIPNIFFNTCFDKNHLKTLIAWFLEKYGEKKTVDLVETLKQIGFSQATRAGISLGVDDLQIPPQKGPLLYQSTEKGKEASQAYAAGNLTNVEKSQRLIDSWNETSDTLRQAAVQNFRTTNPVNPVYMMAFSGARGNISQVRQLVAMRGLMADPQGAILEFPIQSNFREGLTVTEYLLSCYGARKGLVDTALRTATSGYLTRRLVDAVQHVVIQVRNCHTQKGILLKNKNLEKRLVGRVLLHDVCLDIENTIIPKDTLVSARLAKQLAAKFQEIHVRSPLTCKTQKSVCQLCYGLDLGQGKLVSLGEAVGIIAAQSIGEPGTQLTMRTFHTGGVGVFSEQAMKSFTAPFPGKIEFQESVPGIMVRTPHGKIVYLIKNQSKNNEQILVRLISPTSQVYEIKQADVPVGSLLWVKQGEKVKSGQLLVQASRLETAKQEMPESTHPVQSPLSGELVCESLWVQTLEEIHKIGPKNKYEEEITPTVSYVRKLGTFWVVSGFIQKQPAFASSFFIKGDRLSLKTPIFQYNLQISTKGQLKKHQKDFIFIQNSHQIAFSQIYYFGIFYFLVEKKSVVAYTTRTDSTHVTWYPNVKNLELPFSGYLFVLENQKTTHFGKKKGQIKHGHFQEKFLSAKNQVFVFRKGELCALPGPPNCVQFGGKEQKRHHSFKFLESPSSCFIITGDELSLSRKGLFHLKQDSKIVWLPKQSSTHTVVKNSPFGVFFGIKKDKKQKRQHLNFSVFLKKIWKEPQKFLIQGGNTSKLVHKQQTWLCVLDATRINDFRSQFTGIVLQPGQKFKGLSFGHSYVSVNMLSAANVFIIRSKQGTSLFTFDSISDLSKHSFQKNLPKIFKELNLTQTIPERKLRGPLFSYSSQEILSLNSKFVCFLKNNTVIPQNQGLGTNLDPLNRFSTKFSIKVLSQFSFYKKNQSTNTKKTTTNKKNTRKFTPLSVSIKAKRPVSYFACFQKNSDHFVPDKKYFYEKWLLQNKSPVKFSITSPLSTKQFKTDKLFLTNEHPKFNFQIQIVSTSGWISKANFLKIQLEIRTPRMFRKFEQVQQKPQTALKILIARNISFNKDAISKFQTFSDDWILPNFTVTRLFMTSPKAGEFRRIQPKLFLATERAKKYRLNYTQKEELFISILRTQDIFALMLPKNDFRPEKNQFMQCGRGVRWGQKLLSNFASSLNGQIMKVTATKLTVRKAVPFLASPSCLIHVTDQDLIEKNQLLITLKSKRLQTEDIVQGIPKIEQLFEARETQGGQKVRNNVHERLNYMFRLAKKVKPISEAVELSVRYIQLFLVKSILEAYSNQGVHIDEKHVEIVVRQMTTRVRILSGGDTGFLPGEFVQLRVIEELNLKLAAQGTYRRQATYEPIVLGITKSVLQSESFLLAASFQQVSKVLVRSALAKKTDFLRGLHENLLVGQMIPAGTGCFNLPKFNIPITQSQEGFDPITGKLSSFQNLE